MPLFWVDVAEVWERSIKVEAESAEAARAKVARWDTEPIEETTEFSHSMAPETWGVQEVER